MSTMRRRVDFAVRTASLSTVMFATWLFAHDHLLEATVINGQSMAPTLSPSFSATGARDLVLWRKLAPTAGLARGDIIAFYSPNGPLDTSSVKRVVALPGDLVVLDARRRPPPVLNGRPNPDHLRWLAWRDGKVRVPEGHLWVEGDNHRASADSNTYGPISKSLVQGRAIAVLWPPHRAGTKPWLEENGRRKTKVVVGGAKEWAGND